MGYRHWANILKDMNRGLPGPGGGGTCFPPLTHEETGAQGEEVACSRFGGGGYEGRAWALNLCARSPAPGFP